MNCTATKCCIVCKKYRKLYEFGPRCQWRKCRHCRKAKLQPDEAVEKERRWEIDLWFRYRMPKEEYWNRFENQGGVCAICRNPPPKDKRLHVDHNHTTLKNRGLLCDQCNWGIGNLKENVETIRRALAYIQWDQAEGTKYLDFATHYKEAA